MADAPERPPRRIHLLTMALKPVRKEIGALQKAMVFLMARSDFTRRKPGDPVTAGEVEEKRQALLRVQALFDATVSELPDIMQSDSRTHDARAALARLEVSLANLATGAAAAANRTNAPR